jgi:small subunit ribosomal protein S3Ae
VLLSLQAHTDVKTTDGYVLRLFVIGFTKRRNNQTRKTSYAQSAQVQHFVPALYVLCALTLFAIRQVRTIRKKMVDIMQKEASTVDLNELVIRFQTEVIGKEIERATQGTRRLRSLVCGSLA